MIYEAILLAVVDGDTFKAKVEVWPNVQVTTSIRLAGVDTPELRGKCPEEIAAAKAAQARLGSLLAGQIIVSKIKLDKYASRVDAYVVVNDIPIADRLVSEGFARYYTSGPRKGWCP